jgi:hypothetical protein
MIQFLRSLMAALSSLYLARRMLKVAFGHCCGLFLSFFCHCPSFKLFGLSSSATTLPYDYLLAFGQLGLKWSNQDLLPIEFDHVHVYQE